MKTHMKIMHLDDKWIIIVCPHHQFLPSVDVVKSRKMIAEKHATETWGFQVLPSLYSKYQKVDEIESICFSSLLQLLYFFFYSKRKLSVQYSLKSKIRFSFLILFFFFVTHFKTKNVSLFSSFFLECCVICILIFLYFSFAFFFLRNSFLIWKKIGHLYKFISFGNLAISYGYGCSVHIWLL